MGSNVLVQLSGMLEFIIFIDIQKEISSFFTKLLPQILICQFRWNFRAIICYMIEKLFSQSGKYILAAIVPHSAVGNSDSGFRLTEADINQPGMVKVNILKYRFVRADII